MKFQLAVLSLFCGASSVYSFAPQQPSQRAVASTSAFSPSTLFSTAAKAEEGVATTGDDDEKHGLSPEYQTALETAKGSISKILAGAPEPMIESLFYFCNEYLAAHQKSNEKYSDPGSTAGATLKMLMEGIQYGMQYGMGPNKFTFGVTHDAMRGDDEASREAGVTLDFYKWGCDFFKHIVDLEESVLMGEDNLEKALEQAAKGENVVFFANHQSEADPQVMSLLLEKHGHAKEASEIVFVAGHKVTTDALAIPFSMGRNLICIHSKKHIDTDPDTKVAKSKENMRAMSGMLGKLKAGGCILWVAPSGGRDRRNVEAGNTPIAPFDDKTIDMFRLMGRKSKVPTHYYPLSMVTYELCPPPDFVEAGTGEQRNFRFTPVGVNVGDEIDAGAGDEAFKPGAFEQTKSDYFHLRERIFPGTAPPKEE
mmetsp:Transcript_6053/g.12702  ORF Transcript_6053/g.12702 Transcript_6053/m.12702 type:complete len:424 (-) Transcript_6053:726-1997(-)|eukprot:CAMPEP_0201170296 /NCGR_PEP_ID=MMETSP0851-20130426/83648_1 /ASSEMBLY_ACC=CAM_ASM_000631 /TAXON_ID=183588 /ORGANISM="Pseudo-nitzschia fraudulenta, Strain WWA7" /LENGTH=423 /DNA_ID=CAMNT_0047452299 /DNA_START=203 /DNA_END=1474 /DNA_ORIENTATION=-